MTLGLTQEACLLSPNRMASHSGAKPNLNASVWHLKKSNSNFHPWEEVHEFLRHAALTVGVHPDRVLDNQRPHKPPLGSGLRSLKNEKPGQIRTGQIKQKAFCVEKLPTKAKQGQIRNGQVRPNEANPLCVGVDRTAHRGIGSKPKFWPGGRISGTGLSSSYPGISQSQWFNI